MERGLRNKLSVCDDAMDEDFKTTKDEIVDSLVNGDKQTSIEETFQKLDINIKNEDGTYKLFTEVLEELAEAWDKL